MLVVKVSFWSQKTGSVGGVQVGTSGVISNTSSRFWRSSRLLALVILASICGMACPTGSARADVTPNRIHEGVGSCAGSACHGRQVATPPDIRHNEILTWQSDNGPAGAHSRAWKVLSSSRAQSIATRLGLGPATSAPACLGCHADNAARRGQMFQISDGVGCEACHGGSGDWLSSHFTVGARHADNVAKGLIPLENPKVRASVCLDCHFGGAGAGQFVTHQIMSAGHPRIAFELDLFSTLQKHYDLGANYAARKPIPSGVTLWAVGQAMALDRSLTLYSDARHGQEGIFPEFYFFDCHSCHRAISDDPRARPTAVANPGRPIPSGTAPYNDENLIMLSAAAKVAAPKLSPTFEAQTLAFHTALATDRSAAVRAAAQLAGTSRALASAFAQRQFTREDTIAMLNQIVGEAEAPRYTDYTGSAQSVMAIDTLVNALVASGQLDGGRAAALRPDIDRAYKAVNDPNSYRPAEFRLAITRVATAVRALR
jgi:hypothetical protein